MENQMVRKANYLIEAAYKLSTVEQKIILFLASTISSEDADFKSYPLRIKTFQSFLGNTSSNYDRIEEVILALKEKNLKIVYPNDQGKRVILNVNWLSSSKYTEGSGIIELRFDPELKPFLLQLKSRFTNYRLKNVVQLKSQFSIRIYELLKQYEKLGKRLFTISELRFILGIDDDQYRQYTDFRKRVILVAQAELAEKTDISFDFEELKVGHRVGQIRFIIKSKTQEKPLLDEPEVASAMPTPREPNDFEKLIALLPPEYREKESLRKLLATWLEKQGVDYVARNIEYANEGSNAVKPGVKLGKGSNYRVYLSKALVGDFGLPHKEDKEAERQAEAEARRRAQVAADEQKRHQTQTQKQKEDLERARIFQQNLPPEALDHLKAEALSRLLPDHQEMVKKKSVGAEMMLKLMMDKIALERMKIS